MSLPLVEPGPELTADQRRRYARQLLVPSIGEVGQRRLLAAKVAVVGAGGLGSPTLLYLAGAGLGQLTVIDDDQVDLTNLHRQVLHETAAVGTSKAESAASRLRGLNPDIVVRPIQARLTRNNADELLAGHDLVIDGADNFDTRYVNSDACVRLGIPHLWASVYRSQAQVSSFWSKAEPPITLRDLFPNTPDASQVPSCGDAGVLGPICGQVGAILAGEAIKLICGVGRPLIGRLLFCDLLEGSQREIPIRPAPLQPASGRTPVVTFAPRIEPPQQVTAHDLAAELASSSPPLVLDVREPAEWSFGLIAGALTIPLADLLSGAAVPLDRPIVVTCKTGPRAQRAAVELLARGATVRTLSGGMAAWTQHIDPSLIDY